MKFVDWVGFLDGGDFDESKHPRGDDGKFSNSSGCAGSPKFKQKIRDLKQRLQNGERPRDILKEAAGLLEGEYECEFPDGEKATLVFDSDFKKESGKYLYSRFGRPYPMKVQKKNAMRQLEAYEHAEELIREGKRSGWSHSEGHHPDKDFVTIWKSAKLSGGPSIVALDAYRMSNNPKGKKTAHNMSTEGNPGFKAKKKHLGMGDAAPDEFLKVVRVYVLQEKDEPQESRE